MPQILESSERDRIAAHNLDLVSAAKCDVTDEMMLLAEQLSLIHGRIRVTNERSGIHFYMPSPACLEQNGADELQKMHLAVNVQKYYQGAGDQDRCGLCMKTSTPYRVSDLLAMPPLNDRGYELKPQVLKVAKTNLDHMEKDASGAWIPKGPGEVVPVYTLPANHPAQQYLRSRQFDAEALWHQFRLSYGVKERADVYYKRMLGGFRASPQGRIIFYIDVAGINRGWQSRILEMDHEGVRYYYQGYTNKWVPVLKQAGEKWVPNGEQWVGWDPVKYAIGVGAHRNEALLGFDAAVAWNDAHNAGGTRWCVLAEGGLDAGRVGVPAMAIMGKAFSDGQCRLVAEKFDRVLYVKDLDQAGDQAAAAVQRRFADLRDLTPPQLLVTSVPQGKDLGEMEPEAARQFIESHIYG